MNIEELRGFLLEANQAGFAGGEEKAWVKEKDGSTTIMFEKGIYKMNDNFFGGEPYGGRIIVHQGDHPIWMMVYYGWVKEGINSDTIYAILKEALKQMPVEAPFRGPKEMNSGGFKYLNIWEGNIERYSGEEQIQEEGKVVYKANYLGGWVDLKK